MNAVYDKLQACYKEIQKKITFKPQIALVLGSGLGAYADHIQVEAVLDYKDIEGFPVSTVSGHAGRFVFGYVGEEKVPVVIMQGRVHYYEGYDMTDVVLPVRLMGMMGAKILFLTNAAGGINTSFRPGDLMMITDHIASFVPNPLIGPNMEELGTRFPDMSEIYSVKLQEVMKKAADELGILMQEGVYLQLTGPSFESAAEIRMGRALGADAVGMSTACEAIAARHMGMNVCGLSTITNMACGITKEALSHKEVKEVGKQNEEKVKEFVTKCLMEMGE